jgi:hypothetical protein
VLRAKVLSSRLWRVLRFIVPGTLMNASLDNAVLIGDGYKDYMVEGLMLLLQGVALGEAANLLFPRSIFVAGGTSVV